MEDFAPGTEIVVRGLAGAAGANLAAELDGLLAKARICG
jgi:hypothetical protein